MAMTHARRIALAEGLEGLSFGRVAKDAGMAKSSLQVLFGDREKLQQSTLTDGVEEVAVKVAALVRADPDASSHPLTALCDAWFSIIAQDQCGGCLLTASVAEYSLRAGSVATAVRSSYDRWRDALLAAAERGVERGEVARGTDLPQLVFEVLSLQTAANIGILVGDQGAIERAREGVRARIMGAGDVVRFNRPAGSAVDDQVRA
nr:TetR/AcrR family transcriptional regulator [Sphingomonas gellani]